MTMRPSRSAALLSSVSSGSGIPFTSRKIFMNSLPVIVSFSIRNAAILSSASRFSARSFFASAYAAFKHLHDFLVDLAGCGIPAVQDGSAVQIAVLDGLKPHQAETLGHPVLCDHGTGDLRGLLDIIGCACRHRIKDDLLRRRARRVPLRSWPPALSSYLRTSPPPASASHIRELPWSSARS